FSVDGGATRSAFTLQQADDTVLLAGGGVRVAYGLTHNLEAGGRLRAAYGSGLRLDDAVYDAAPATLWFDALELEAVADLRFIVGIQQSAFFERTHPLVGVHAGLLGTRLTHQVLLDPDPKSGGTLAQPADDLLLRPVVGLDLGVEHRFGRAFVVGLIASSDYNLDGLNTRAVLEVSWHWY